MDFLNLLIPGFVLAGVTAVTSYFQKQFNAISVVAGIFTASLASIITQYSTETLLFSKDVIPPAPPSPPPSPPPVEKVNKPAPVTTIPNRERKSGLPSITAKPTKEMMVAAAAAPELKVLDAYLEKFPELEKDAEIMRAVTKQLIEVGRGSIASQQPRYKAYYDALITEKQTFGNGAGAASGLQNRSGPALHYAIHNENFREVNDILDQHPKLARDLGDFGETILQAALMTRNPEMVKLILKRVPEQVRAVNERYETALHKLIGMEVLRENPGMIDMAKLLIEADQTIVRMENGAGTTPIRDLQLDIKFGGSNPVLEAVLKLMEDAQQKLPPEIPPRTSQTVEPAVSELGCFNPLGTPLIPQKLFRA